MRVIRIHMSGPHVLCARLVCAPCAQLKNEVVPGMAGTEVISDVRELAEIVGELEEPSIEEKLLQTISCCGQSITHYTIAPLF